MSVPVLAARGLVVEYGTPRGRLRAVAGADLEVAPGEAVAIVGESGSGKSTLLRALLALETLAAGRVEWEGTVPTTLPAAELRRRRARFQPVFQDPAASLDPRLGALEAVAEPLAIHRPDLGREAIAARAATWLERVGIEPALHARRPHALSGGQCQRVAIARATILAPALLACDEPVASLDASLRARLLDLLQELRREHGTALLVVTHDLAVARRLADRVLVTYLGRIVERAPRETFFGAPRHPYSQRLLDAVPVADPARERARPPVPDGEPASPFAPPSGCPYRTRCPRAIDRCTRDQPALEPVGPAHAVACHRRAEPASDPRRAGTAAAGEPPPPAA